MNKNEFLSCLRRSLSMLPKEEIDNRVNFFAEIIDDNIESGMSEAEAVSKIESVESIAAQIIAERSQSLTQDKNNTSDPQEKRTKNLSAGMITLLILGSPIWISLIAALFAILISLPASVFSVVISFWAAFVSICAVAVCGIPLGVILFFTGSVSDGFLCIGCAVFSAGLSVFAFLFCKFLTKYTLIFTKWLVFETKRIFAKEK